MSSFISVAKYGILELEGNLFNARDNAPIPPANDEKSVVIFVFPTVCMNLTISESSF